MIRDEMKRRQEQATTDFAANAAEQISDYFLPPLLGRSLSTLQILELRNLLREAHAAACPHVAINEHTAIVIKEDAVRIGALREALEFYGHRGNYAITFEETALMKMEPTTRVHSDLGAIARAALASTTEEDK